MRKAKTEIKIEPYPKGGWYVVERVNNKVWWKSSNYQSLELDETRKKEREELKTNMAKLLDKNTSRRQKNKEMVYLLRKQQKTVHEMLDCVI